MPISNVLASLTVPITGNAAPLFRTLAGVRTALSGVLGLGAIAGIGASIGFAAKTSIQLEQSLVDLDKVTDLSSSQIADLGSQLEQLAVKMKIVPVDRLFAIATAGAKLGYAGTVLLQYTEGIAKASAVIKDVPVEQLSDDLGRLNNQFKLGVHGNEQMASAIAKVADSGSSATSQVLDIASRISGLATVARITAPEVIALSGVIGDSTKYSESAATALILLIQNLNDLESQKGFARTIGISADEFAKRVHDKPIGAIEDFLGALNKLDAGAQGRALASIGVEGARGLGNLEKLSQSFNDISKYTKFANDEFRTTERLQRAYGKEAGTTGAALTLLGIQTTIAAKSIGDALKPAIISAADTIGTFATKLPDLVDSFRVLAGTDWAKGIADSFSVNLPSAAGFMDALGYTIRNFDLILKETGVKIGIEVANIDATIGYGFSLIGATFDYGLQVIQSWADSAFNVFIDLSNKLLPVFDAIFRPLFDGIDRGIREIARLSNVIEAISAGKGISDIYAASGLPEPGSSGIKANFKPVERVPVTQPEFKAPEFKPIDVNDFLKPIHDEMQAREDAFAARRKPKLPIGQEGEGAPGGQRPEGVAGPAVAGKGAGGVLDLVAYFNKLQGGALTSKDPAERTAKGIADGNKILSDIRTAVKKPGGGIGPAVVGPA